MSQQHGASATVWTATSWHTDSLCGIAQTVWADPSGHYAAIRHNIIEGGFYSACDRCSSELLTADGENFDYEQDAIDAFVLRNWRMHDGTILCAQCVRAYRDVGDKEETTMNYAILKKDELRRDGNSYEFEGYRHGDTDISFIWVDLPPGSGPRLHKHAYAEILIIQEGRGTYTVGSTTLEAQAGQVVMIPPDAAHKFFNSGAEPLRQIDLHLSKRIVTEWLED